MYPSSQMQNGINLIEHSYELIFRADRSDCDRRDFWRKVWDAATPPVSRLHRDARLMQLSAKRHANKTGCARNQTTLHVLNDVPAIGLDNKPIRSHVLTA